MAALLIQIKRNTNEVESVETGDGMLSVETRDGMLRVWRLVTGC